MERPEHTHTPTPTHTYSLPLGFNLCIKYTFGGKLTEAHYSISAHKWRTDSENLTVALTSEGEKGAKLILVAT